MEQPSNATTTHALRLAAVLLFAAPKLFAQSRPPDSVAVTRLAPLDFTLLDAPYNTSFGGRGPSMQQSLDLTVAQYEVVHGAIQRAFGRRRTLGRIATGVYDMLSAVELALPFTDVWVHEEFHRAQLGRRGIGSFDDIYRFQPNAIAISVSHVTDENIARLKAIHPAEWVRVNEAGAEGELTMVRALERRQFQGYSRGWHIPLYWFAKFSSAGYVASSVWAETDDDTDEMNRQEGADVPRRDFTGHDFLAWTYDLHRPTEPYAARGTHPSGVGINRYIKLTDLTDEERRWIRKEGRLQFLNFVDPFLFGLGGVRIGGDDAQPTIATAMLSHVLTSFGHVIDGEVLVRRGGIVSSATLHLYENGNRRCPGVELQTFDLSRTVAGHALEFTPRLMGWLQPKDQSFRTSEATPGGLVSLRVRSAGRGLNVFGEIEAKSAGWVAGTPYLNSGVSLRTGLTARLH